MPWPSGLIGRISSDIQWIEMGQVYLAAFTDSSKVTMRHALGACAAVDSTIGRLIYEQCKTSRERVISAIGDYGEFHVGRITNNDENIWRAKEILNSIVPDGAVAGSTAWFASLVLASSWDDLAILRELQIPCDLVLRIVTERFLPTSESTDCEEDTDISKKMFR